MPIKQQGYRCSLSISGLKPKPSLTYYFSNKIATKPKARLTALFLSNIGHAEAMLAFGKRTHS